MDEAPAREVREPAADERIVKRGDAEELLARDRPEVDERGRARADEDRAEDAVRECVHGLAFGGWKAAQSHFKST